MKWTQAKTRILRAAVPVAAMVVLCNGLVPLALAHPEVCVPCFPCCCPCNGVINAWGGGAVTQAVQPGTSNSCAPGYPCQVTMNGSLSSQTFFGSNGDLGISQPFTSVETFDLQHSTPNGAGGLCYPAVGDLTVTDSADSTSTIIFHFQGQGCQIPSDSTGLLVTATYVIEDNSTGRFTGTSGVGTFSQFAPLTTAALPGTPPMSLAGNFHIATPAQLAVRAMARARPGSPEWSLAAIVVSLPERCTAKPSDATQIPMRTPLPAIIPAGQ